MVNEFRKKLKKISWIYNLNAFFKARRNKWMLNRLNNFYSKKAKLLGITYKEDEIKDRIQERLAKRGIILKPKTFGELKIFLMTYNPSQDESGFLQAMRKAGEIVILKNDNNGIGFRGYQPDECSSLIAKIIESNNRALIDQVREEHKKKKIDFVIGQIWADIVDVNALIEVQKMRIPTVNISMDDKLPDLWGNERGRRMGSVGLVDGLDLILTTTASVCEWYMVEGCPAIYWPLASDPNIFYPRADKKYDVAFIGSNYGMRGKLVRAIMAAGVNIAAFGPGWPNGAVGAEESGRIFGEAKIILGTGTIGYNEDIFTIKLRDFDAPMSGALYITHRNPDLLKLFKEGEEIECYLTIEECVRKIKYYLENLDKLEKITQAGLLKARENYTWEKRIKDTLRLLNLA